MNSKILWSIALGISFLLFVVNAFWKSKTSKSNVASGFILWQASDGWVNYVLYPFMIGWLGMKWGFVVMFFVSLIGNLVYIKINTATSYDWTLMETFRNIGFIKRVIEWKIGRLCIGKAIGFVLFSIKFDSFYALNFLYGKQADLKKVKVWILFLTSHALCNFAWTLVVGGILAFAKTLLKSVNFF